MSPLRAHDLVRPGSTVRCWTAGTDGRPTVVFLHSATLDHRAWAPQTDALRDRFRVVALDLRGHGASSGAFDFDAAVEDVVALLDQLAGGRVVLVGLSLGADIAQEVIRRRPDSVLALVVAGSVTSPGPGHRPAVPTLLVHGELDSARDVAAGMRAWAERESLARHVLIPNAGHSSNLDNPAAFTALLTTFLAEVLPSARDEAYAEELYRRYGARPWHPIPEPTLEHYRGLVAAGIDGQGRSLPSGR